MRNSRNMNKQKKQVGRPPKIDKNTLGKLEQAFKMGATDREACFYANINPDTLYEYQKKNPAFTEQKEAWKQNPVLKAKHTIYKSLDDPRTAQWYLERKCKDEFSTQSKLELESKGINIVVADDEHKKMLEDL